MSTVDPFVAELMEEYVPLRRERRPSWDDVLERAAARGARPRMRRARRLALAVAALILALAVGAAVAAAFGHNVFGGLGSWLSGSPGRPAPAAEQAGFVRRSSASYARFPAGTKLRLLVDEVVGGKRFSLLGVRNGSSLCLRLVRADSPAAQGVNECVTLRELRRSPAPALVASTAYLRVSRRHMAGGIFGFVEDDVHGLEVVRSLGGRQAAVLGGNAFLALSVLGPTYDPIVRVRATAGNGRSVAVPFPGNASGPIPPGAPVYWRLAPLTFAGPARPQAQLSHPTIGWLDRREPRGQPFIPNLTLFGPGQGNVVFSRSIQPDPGNPFRIGLSLISVGPHPGDFVPGPEWGETIPLRPGLRLLCAAELYPLRPKPIGYLCTKAGTSALLFRARHPLTVRRMFREVYTRVSGLAADGIDEVDLYLANGRVIPAALRDNAYTVEASSQDFPAKIVAFDHHHRAVEVDVIGLDQRITLTACPAALPARGRSADVKPYERIDLATAHVAGRPILGRRIAQIEHALGEPGAITATQMLYGGTSAGDALLTISLREQRAVGLTYRDPALVDARLGRLLTLQPPDLERRIATTYGRSFTLRVGYGSDPGLVGCSGLFSATSGPTELSFGLDHNRPTTFLRLTTPTPVHT